MRGLELGGRQLCLSRTRAQISRTAGQGGAGPSCAERRQSRRGCDWNVNVFLARGWNLKDGRAEGTVTDVTEIELTVVPQPAGGEWGGGCHCAN